MSNKAFQSINGDVSSARITGFMIVVVALVFVQEILWFGRSDPMTAATAAGTLFLTIATPAMAYLYANKREEVKAEKVKQKNE